MMYTLRRLGPADREEIKKVFVGVFTKEPWCDDWSDREQLDLYIRDLTCQGYSLTYGLYDNTDELIGISLGYIKHWYSGTEYIINELCIRTDRQGAGAGTFFLREIEKAIRAIGVKQIFLLTDSNVPAYEFYRKNGFAESKTNVAFSKSVMTHHNLLFDLDQTLLDFHASEYKALGIVLRSHGLFFSDEIYEAFRAYNKSLWLELEKGTISRTELFTRRFQDVFARCGGDTAGLDPLKVNDEFIRTMSVNGVLMDGALELMEKVKAGIPDARVYIASNGATVNAKGRIASTGLDRYIDGIFISEDMGVTKPDPAFFDVCLKQIGEPRSSCIMIGDSLSSDMLGAKNASLTSVWFMPSGNIEEAVTSYSIDYCASSFDELYEVLVRWSGTSAGA